MIIDLNRRFIFIANLKCASTAIEKVLRVGCDIAILDSRFGKHLPYSMIEDRFSWIFEEVRKEDFFVFGVIRDPVDYLISLYNSHGADHFKENAGLYTRDMSFDDFLWEWSKENGDQMKPQHTRFLDKSGTLVYRLRLMVQALD